MFFKSAIDPSIYLMAVGFPVALFLCIFPTVEGMPTIAILAMLAVTPIWCLLGTYYRVDSTLLRIQCGPFSWSIPLEQIRSVTPSRSWRHAPALSFDRLNINYRRFSRSKASASRSILVSPQNRTAFVEALGFEPNEILLKSPG